MFRSPKFISECESEETDGSTRKYNLIVAVSELSTFRMGPGLVMEDRMADPRFLFGYANITCLRNRRLYETPGVIECIYLKLKGKPIPNTPTNKFKEEFILYERLRNRGIRLFPTDYLRDKLKERLIEIGEGEEKARGIVIKLIEGVSPGLKDFHTHSSEIDRIEFEAESRKFKQLSGVY